MEPHGHDRTQRGRDGKRELCTGRLCEVSVRRHNVQHELCRQYRDAEFGGDKAKHDCLMQQQCEHTGEHLADYEPVRQPVSQGAGEARQHCADDDSRLCNGDLDHGAEELVQFKAKRYEHHGDGERAELHRQQLHHSMREPGHRKRDDHRRQRDEAGAAERVRNGKPIQHRDSRGRDQQICLRLFQSRGHTEQQQARHERRGRRNGEEHQCDRRRSDSDELALSDGRAARHGDYHDHSDRQPRAERDADAERSNACL